MTLTVRHGDMREALATMDADSVDACVTDPPYELAFMGRAWDQTGVAFQPDTWRAVWRILKPGGYMLCFGGSRTFARMFCAIEDAGFEYRDTLMWLYGTGFPKSLDVSKAIDRAAGAEREIVGGGRSGARQCYNGQNAGRSKDFLSGDYDITLPATPVSARWQGWGTALKPAFEPIILARKPLAEGTVAANVLRHGTGALNINACRVGTSGGGQNGRAVGSLDRDNWRQGPVGRTILPLGRWPANVLHDGSAEVEAAFPAFGERTSGNLDRSRIVAENKIFGAAPKERVGTYEANTGTASRFFYSAKASKADRAGSKHPTVKPVALMRWLVRLITPPGGAVLDPFAGSGTTGQAAAEQGFAAILVEQDAESMADIYRRLGTRPEPARKPPRLAYVPPPVLPASSLPLFAATQAEA